MRVHEHFEPLSNAAWRRPRVFQQPASPDIIRVRFYQGLGENRVETEQRRYLQTPGMAAPPLSEMERYASLEEALDDVIREFSEGYDAAVQAGHNPDVNRLLPNRDFH
jgi:hypothetical protein